MGWTWLWWLLILVGVVAVVVGLMWAARGGRGGGESGGAAGPPVSTARQILDERFARGEIDEEEYRARRRMLDA
jgi:putative membrane protein